MVHIIEDYMEILVQGDWKQSLPKQEGRRHSCNAQNYMGDITHCNLSVYYNR